MDTLNFGRKIALQNLLERLRYLKNNGDIETFLNEREVRIELYRDLETLNNNSITNLIQEIDAGRIPIIDAEITAIESALTQIEDIITAEGSAPPQTQNIQALVEQYQQHLNQQRQARVARQAKTTGIQQTNLPTPTTPQQKQEPHTYVVTPTKTPPQNQSNIAKINEVIEVYKQNPQSPLWGQHNQEKLIEQLYKLEPALHAYQEKDGTLRPEVKQFVIAEGLTTLQEKIATTQTQQPLSQEVQTLITELIQLEQQAREQLKAQFKEQHSRTITPRPQTQENQQTLNKIIETAINQTAEEIPLTAIQTGLAPTFSEKIYQAIQQQPPEIQKQLAKETTYVANEIAQQTTEQISYKGALEEALKNTTQTLLTRESTINRQNQREQVVNPLQKTAEKIVQKTGAVLNMPMPDFAWQKPTIKAIADTYAKLVTTIPMTADIPSVLEHCRQAATQTLQSCLPKEIRDEYLKPAQEVTDKGKALIEAMAATATATFATKKQEQFKQEVLKEVVQRTIQDTKKATEYIRSVGIQPTTQRNQAQGQPQQNETPYSFTQPTTIQYSATQNEGRIRAVKETIDAILPTIEKLPTNATPQEVESAVKIALTTKITAEPTVNKLVTPLIDVIVGATTDAYTTTQNKYNQPMQATQTQANPEIATALEKVVTKATQTTNIQIVNDLTPHLTNLDPTRPANQLLNEAKTIIEETIKQKAPQEIPNLIDSNGQLTTQANELINAMSIAAVQAIKRAPEKQNQTQIPQNITRADIAALGFNPDVVQPIQTQSSITTQSVPPERQSAEQAAQIFAKQMQEAAENYSAVQQVIAQTDKASRLIEEKIKNIIDEINQNADKQTKKISNEEKGVIAANITAKLTTQLAGVKNEDLQGTILRHLQTELTTEISKINTQLLRNNQQKIEEKVAETATHLAKSPQIQAAATAGMILPFALQAEESLYKDYLTRKEIGLQRATDKYFEINLGNKTVTLLPDQILREIYRDDYKTDYRVGIQAIAPELSASLSETLAQDLTTKMFGAVRIVPDYETTQAKQPKIFETWGILEDLHDQLSLYEKWRINQLSPEEKEKYTAKRQADREKYLISSTVVAFRITLEEQHDQLINTNAAIQTRLEELKNKPNTQLTPEEKKELRTLSKQAERIQGAINQLESFKTRIQTDKIEVDENHLQKLHNKLHISEREEKHLQTRLNKLLAIPEGERTEKQIQRINEINQQLAILAQRNEELRRAILSLSNEGVDLKQQQRLFQERYEQTRREKQLNNTLLKLTALGVLTEKQTKQAESLKEIIKNIQITKANITTKIKNVGEKKSFATLIQNITQNGLRYEEMKKIMAEKETQQNKDYQPHWYKLANAKNPFSTINFLLDPDAVERSMIGLALNTPTGLVLGTFKMMGVNPADTTFGILQSVLENKRHIQLGIFEQRIINLSRATGINVELMVKTGIIDPGLYNKLSYTHQLQLQLLIREHKNHLHYEQLKKKHPKLINWLEKRAKAKDKIWRRTLDEGFILLLNGRIDDLPKIWAKRCITYATNKALLKIAPNVFGFDPSKGRIIIKPWETFKDKTKKTAINAIKKVAKAIAQPIWNVIKKTVVGTVIKTAAKLLLGLAAQIIPIVGQAIGIILLVDSLIEKIPIIGQIYSTIKNIIINLVKIYLLALLIWFIQTFLWLLQLAAWIGSTIGAGISAIVSWGSKILSPLQSLQITTPGLPSLGMINPLGFGFTYGSTFFTNLGIKLNAITSSIASTGQAIFTFATSGGPLVTATYAAIAATTIGSLISSGTFVEIFKVAPDGVSGDTPPRFPISPTASQIIKTASRTSVNNGEPIIYTIKLEAPACAPTITVTDTVPQNAVFVTFREQSPADPIPDTNPIQSITRTGPDDQRKITWTITLKDGRYTTPCAQQRGGGILRDVNYITLEEINNLIAGSPIAGQGQLIQNLAEQHKVNPMLVLAIFQRETQMGQTGPGRPNQEARPRTNRDTNLGCNNLGNMRNGSYADKHGALKAPGGTNLCTFGERNNDAFALFPNYESSIRATFDLLDEYYLTRRRATTVERIANIYSPENDPVGSNIAPVQECNLTNETKAQQANRIFKEMISCSLAQKRFCREPCRIFELNETNINVNSNTINATLRYEVTANVEQEDGRGCITNQVTATAGNEPSQQNIIGTSTVTTSVGGAQCGLGGSTIAEAANNLLGPERRGPLVRCIDPEHAESRKTCQTGFGTAQNFYSHHLNFDGDTNEENIYQGLGRGNDGFAWFWCTWTPIKSYQAIGKNALNGQYAAQGQRQVFINNGGYFTIRSSRNNTTQNNLDPSRIKPGDVIFFFTDRSNENVHHVGIVYSINLDENGTGNIETRESNSTVKTRMIRVERLKITDPGEAFRVAGFGLQDSIE